MRAYKLRSSSTSITSAIPAMEKEPFLDHLLQWAELTGLAVGAMNPFSSLGCADGHSPAPSPSPAAFHSALSSMVSSPSVTSEIPAAGAVHEIFSHLGGAAAYVASNNGVRVEESSARKRKNSRGKGKGAAADMIVKRCKVDSGGGGGDDEATKASGEQSGCSSLNSDGDGKIKGKESVGVKPPEPPKDYIHVRARRGQATDSHSLAERVRRERISERMKLLQDLVPGCNKVIGKAVMLDEIINYVQSLQRQVEFLSMKLATVNPTLDFSPANFLQKDVLQSTPQPQCAVGHGSLGLLSSVDDFGSSATHFSQTGSFWEDDLHSFVQMGYSDRGNHLG